MDVLTREPEPIGLESLPSTERPGPRPGAVSVVLAMMAFGAAILHAAFAPGHFGEAWSHGLFFAVVAWAQLALAIALIVRPSKVVYLAGLLNVGVIAVWVLSRTTGVPVGPNRGTPEAVGFPDVLATGLEAFVVVGCAWMLLRQADVPAARGASGWTRAQIIGVGAVGLLVAGLTTASLTPRYAGEHEHGGSDETAAAAVDHDHPSTASANATAPALTGTTPCELSGPPASEGQVLDDQGHSHRGPIEQVALTERETIALQQQQVLARGAADANPTVAAAEAAGYHQSTPYIPCIGAHYTKLALVGRFDPAQPSELLFDGTTPDAKIVGLSYLVYHPDGAPEGFAGPNDHWHQHNTNGGLCFDGGLVIAGEATSEADCKALGGVKRELPDVWMLHDWVVPGWECTWGVFAPECPELGGTINGSAWTG